MFAQIQANLFEILVNPSLRAGAIVLGSILIAFLSWVLISRVIPVFTRKTKTEIDDQIILALRLPVLVSIILAGIAWAIGSYAVPLTARFVIFGIIKTLLVFIWASACMKVAKVFLETLGRHAGKLALVQPRTVPLFDILVKVVVVGGAAYFALLSWKINVTGWLASAGVVGIAVGFAAKDTLANLFAGIFILADAPYKLGDFIVLDNGERGRVTDIGIRTTRILTRDDIEITVPNAVIANSKITNETGGPYEQERVRVTVFVAYGTDVDQVRALLLKCPESVPHVAKHPEPRVRFREFGDSGLKFQLLAWIDEPVLRGRVLDQLNTRVYKAFNAAGIEIPYAKHDLYIKEMPSPKS